MSDTDQYLIGIDIGTSIIKSVLIGLDGNEIATESAPNIIQTLHPGWGEQDMDRVWEETRGTLERLVRKNKIDKKQIHAIGITGQGEGTWLIDLKGRPVRSAILWLDGRTGDIVSRWQTEGRNEKFFEKTGTVLTTSGQATQLYWLKMNEPETLRTTSTVFYAKDWIFFKLTGNIATDESDASHEFFDIAKRTYSDAVFELCEITEWRDRVPVAKPSYENIADILPSIAETLGLQQRTPVVCGPFDVAACAIGVGAVQDGDMCTIIGTAGINQMVMNQPLTDPVNVGHTVCHGPKGTWMRMMPTMTSTVSLDWFIREFCKVDMKEADKLRVKLWDYLERKIEALPIGSGGIIYHPFIDPAGERAPFVKPAARAQFLGLNSRHTRYHLLRAIYEGVTMSARDCYEYMPKPIGEVRLAGGGAKSAMWAQMHADITGKVMRVMEGSEFGGKGAAINAGVAIGIYSDFVSAVTKCVRPKARYYPDPKRQEAYQEVFELYRKAYEAVWSFWDDRMTVATRFNAN